MSAADHEQAAREASARRDEKTAAAHAEAARALVADERRTCDGVAPGDVAPGVAGLQVIRVSRLERPLKRQDVVEGAAVVVASNGRSFDGFERLMRCRAARAAVTRDAGDPLAIAGASVRVYRDDGDAVVVQLRSRDPERANEIFRRVEREVGERAPAGGTSSERGEDPLIAAPPRDAGASDPRSHGTQPPEPIVPGGFPPIGGPMGPRRGP